MSNVFSKTHCFSSLYNPKMKTMVDTKTSLMPEAMSSRGVGWVIKGLVDSPFWENSLHQVPSISD